MTLIAKLYYTYIVAVGPVVKRLRHRPFTAVSWVRIPSGSPNSSTYEPLWLVCKLKHLVWCFFIAPTAFAPQTVPSALIRTQVGCVTLTLASKFALLAITGSYTLHNSYLKLKSYFYRHIIFFANPLLKGLLVI